MPTDVIMPSLGAASEESTLVRWLVEEGDTVEKGQPIFEAESDKATVEVGAVASGTMGQLLASPGDVILAGEVVAILLAPDEEPMAEPHAPQPVDLRVPISEFGDRRSAIGNRKGLRAAMVRHMSQGAHTTAPVTLTTEVDATALVELRQLLGAEAGKQSDALSYNLLMAIIAAHALRKHPELNASLTQDGIVQHPQVNIGVAVDTERGLLVPVLRNVPERDLLDLAANLRAKVARALEGRATPQDLSAGTFTLTNLGLYDVDAFTPLINLPECAVLGVGRIRAQAVVREGELVMGQTMALSLTFDHRLVDEGPAARFLQEVARLVENPMLLLLH